MTSLMFDKWYIINDYKDIHEEEDDDGDENFSCLGVTRVHLPPVLLPIDYTSTSHLYLTNCVSRHVARECCIHITL